MAEQSCSEPDAGEWEGVIARALKCPLVASDAAELEDRDTVADGGVRREPELPQHEDIAPAPSPPRNEFEFDDRRDDEEASRNRRIADQMRANAQRAALDPDDGIEL